MERTGVTSEFSAATRRAPASRSAKLASLLLFAAAAVAIVCTLLARLPLMKSPYQLDSVEGDMIYVSSLAAQGRPLYPNPNQIPSIFSPYGPVTYYLMSVVLRAQGIGFAGSRALVLAWTVATAALIALYLAKYSGSWLLGITFGMAWLANLHVSSWFYLARVDLIGIGLSTAGLVLFALRPQRWYWSVPLFVVAWFTKITLIAAAIACFTYLIYQRKYRVAAYYAAYGLGLGLCALWAVEHYLGGWYLFDMFMGHRTPYHLTRALHFIGSAALHAWPFVTLSVIYAAVCLYTRRFSLPVAYLLICSFTIFSASSIAADTNHILEWVTAAYLCAGEAYAELFRADRFPLGRLLFAATATAILVTQAVTVRFREARMESDLSLGTECSRAYAFIRDHGSNVLSSDSGAMAIAGKQPLAVDIDDYRYHGLSDEVLGNLLQRRGADVIALRNPVEEMMATPEPRRAWSTEALDLIQRNYQVSATFNCAYISVVYEPRRPPAPDTTH